MVMRKVVQLGLHNIRAQKDKDFEKKEPENNVKTGRI